MEREIRGARWRPSPRISPERPSIATVVSPVDGRSQANGRSESGAFSPSSVLTLQRSLGNRTTVELLVQRKRGRGAGRPPEWGPAADALLLKAIKFSDLAGVQNALQQGADIRAVDENQRDATQLALEARGRHPGAGGANAQAVLDAVLGTGGAAAGPAPVAPIAPLPFTSADVKDVPDEWARRILYGLVGSVVRFNTLIANQANASVLMDATGAIEAYVVELEPFARTLGDAGWTKLEATRTAVSSRQRLLHESLSNVAPGASPGGGGRGDRHKKYTGINPAALPTADRNIYNDFVGQGKGNQDPGKTQEEAWTAVAAKRANPNLFSRIKPYDKKDIVKFGEVQGDVEYWDNTGYPWDQKTAYWDHHLDVTVAMQRVATAIHEQQEVIFPKRNSPPPGVPVGVLLDCTYIDRTAYGVLWRIIHKMAANGLINLALLVEVKVAEIQASGPREQIEPISGRVSPAGNLAQLQAWASGVSAGGLQTINYQVIVKKLGQSRVDDMINGTGSWSLFRNVAGQLPAGHVYEEYSTGTLLPDGNSARFVYAPEAGLLFLTGTHYHDWVDETSGTQHSGFFEVVGAPVRP